MAEERGIGAEHRRRDAEALGGPAIGGDGVSPGLGAELGVLPSAAGATDPAMAGTKPSMLGVYDRPRGRFGPLGPLILVLAVLGILLLLAYALFATHGGIGAHADATDLIGEILRLPA
jgi:hypothetical protein